jgi:hypothetical protein
VPRISNVLEKEKVVDNAVWERLEALLGTIDLLKELPLALCHIDINTRNVSSFQSIECSQWDDIMWQSVQIILDEGEN